MKKTILIILGMQALYADQAIQNVQRYMLANYYQYGNDLKKAAHWYNQITPDDSASYVYLGYIPFLAATNSFSHIVSLIPKLDTSFKNNVDIQFLFATALERTGNKHDAYSRLIIMNENNKSNQELAFKVMQLYIERSEPENALKVIDNLLNSSARKPNNYIFHFIKAQIYLQKNDKPKALAALKQSLEIYPHFDKSWLLYAVLHEQEGKLEEAVKGYTTYLETSNEANDQIRHHLVNLTFNKTLARMPNTALSDDIPTRLAHIQTLIDKDHFDQAVHLIIEWSSQKKDLDVWLKVLHLLTYLGLSYKKALQATFTIESNIGISPALILYQADFALRDTDQAVALKILAKAAHITKDVNTKLAIALQQAIIYYEQQQWQLAQKILEEARTWDKQYPPINNLLAYIYATKKDDFKQAAHLIALALEKDPENPHFLDTHALILYKQKDYGQAIALLQKAAQTCPDDYTILNHLGKCYYKIGKPEHAIEAMKTAQHVAKNERRVLKTKSHYAHWSKQ
jgi:tetratricopeptide (TPR) repeat protein